MHNLTTMASAVTHQMYGMMRHALDLDGEPDVEADGVAVRDRGAVSLEQVLWFVAAGVSVAVIASILWNTIRDEANQDPTRPTAPSP
jgi:hypothetical protein